MIISKTDWDRRSRYTYFPNLAGRRVFESSVAYFGIIWLGWLKNSSLPNRDKGLRTEKFSLFAVRGGGKIHAKQRRHPESSQKRSQVKKCGANTYLVPTCAAPEASTSKITNEYVQYEPAPVRARMPAGLKSARADSFTESALADSGRAD